MAQRKASDGSTSKESPIPREFLAALASEIDTIPRVDFLYYHNVAGLVQARRDAAAVVEAAASWWPHLEAMFFFAAQPSTRDKQAPPRRFGWLKAHFGVEAPLEPMVATIRELGRFVVNPCARARLLDFLFEFEPPGRARYELGIAAGLELVAAGGIFNEDDGGSADMIDALCRAAEIGRSFSSGGELVTTKVWAMLGAFSCRPATVAVRMPIIDAATAAIQISDGAGDADSLVLAALRERLERIRDAAAAEGAASLIERCVELIEPLAWLASDRDVAAQAALQRVDLIVDAAATAEPAARLYHLMRGAHLLRHVQSKYPPDPSIAARLESVERELVVAGRESRAAMKTSTSTVEVDRAELEGHVRAVLEQPDDVRRFCALLEWCGPTDPAEDRAAALESLDGLIAWRLPIPRLQLEDGRLVGVGGNETQRIEQEAARHAILQVGMRASGVVAPALRAMIRDAAQVLGSVVATFVARALVRPEYADLMDAGLRAWFEERHIDAVHVLVARFEGCLRGLVERLGGGAAKFKPGSGAYHWQSIEELLTELEKLGLPAADARLFRLVMTNAPGSMNLRNKVAHGYAHAGEFNPWASNLVVLCLLALLRVPMSSAVDEHGVDEGGTGPTPE